jgi:uncharacterized repeat protein (TIGR03803 family)
VRGKKIFFRPKAPVALAVLALALFTSQAGAQTKKVLHTFNSQEGVDAFGVIFGPNGHLFGVTTLGSTSGSPGSGTFYELAPTSAGRWLETKSFAFGGKGAFPNPIIFDPDGNIFGTTEVGSGGCGGVFELSLNSNGHWVETVLHDLSCSEGLYPESSTVRDAAGNLYSAAWGGGAHGAGTVFELSPVAGGGWTFKVIHSFDGTDGSQQQSYLTLDASGNIYGMSLCGGKSIPARTPEVASCGGTTGGTAWELSPQSDGSWKEKTLYAFAGGDDGANPSDLGQLIFDAAGNLYGTTQNGGAYDFGVAFELSPNADGSWSEKILHTFTGTDGIAPSGPQVFDAAGNLYGETFGIGCYNHCGGGPQHRGQLVYKLSPNTDGTWTETVLQEFHNSDSGGPAMGLTIDGAGNLYGTTWLGGTYNNGTVFEITP